MSEPLAKERPAVDLDDFERRLRDEDRHHDPLAELARLVSDTPDPYHNVFAQEAVAGHQPHAYHEPYYDGRQEPDFGSSAYAAPSSDPSHSPRLSGDFAAIEAGLRGALSAHSPGDPQDPAATHEYYAQHDQYEQHDPAYLQDHEDQQWAAPPAHAARGSVSRSRRPVYAIAATIAVGVIGVGVAFAYKGTSSSPSEIRTITAAAGPTKIQPPADTKDADAQNPAILGNNNQTAPTQLVNREEQPVDISQAVQQNASRNPDAGPMPGDASGVAVPPSPSQAARGETGDPQSFGMAGMPAPKKVKVVSVRPDGTILNGDAPEASPAPNAMPSMAATGMPAAAPTTPDAAAPTPAPAKPVSPKTATPKTATPKSTSPKTTSRVAAKPAPAPDADQGDDAPAAPAPKSAKKAKPVKVATAEPTSTPDSEPTASLPAHPTGGFAVQLAAPGSEADARSATSRLAKKFAAALDGRRLGFHKAQSNGKSVYRVRVGALSREDAVSLCEKLKANGGSCFVAKNN